MKSIRVQYTVQPEYVAQNVANIQAVMADLRANPIEGLHYSTYQLPDGNSFMHLNISQSEEASKAFGALESFAKFRKGLKASQPTSPPKAEEMTQVGSSSDIV